MAHALVDAAAGAGADAVKFQTFRTERLVGKGAPLAAYQETCVDGSQTQEDMLRVLELSDNDFRDLKAHADERGILFLSTPFDDQSADFLDDLGVPAFKVSSADLTHHELLRRICSKSKPVILSTGMATMDDVREALEVMIRAGSEDIVLLHCVSSYPTPANEANLRAMDTLTAAFGFPVGYSDHTLGCDIAVAAASRGAVVIEKHLTLSRHLPGPDHQASIEPDAFSHLVSRIREVESALGDGLKQPTRNEAEVARVARRSLHAGETIPMGAIVTRAMLVARRPGTGIAPTRASEMAGRHARETIPAGTMLELEMLEES
jgi:N-acetylneuraminate synthase/N,N'-diacetyllegionaminate synthase